MSSSPTPLIGRASELARLAGLIATDTAEPPTVVVLSGDAGVGKTRLLGELISIAGAAGTRCLVGHCIDLGDTPPPYLPFTEAFARLASAEPATVDELLDRYPALARLLPARAVATRLRDERLDRGELFDAVLGGLAWLAEQQPVALLIEDVHWADQATRDLLGFLFTRLAGHRLAIVVSYRSDDLNRRHPLRRTLAEWSRLPLVSRVDLEPLPADDVRALVHQLHAGADLDVEGIVSRADGNAFFAEELTAAAVQDAGGQLPWQLADLLLVRLDRLSAGARQVVRVAAVAGRRVSHSILEAVAGLPQADLDRALREAIDTHVLELTSTGRGYLFRHALLAEAVYDDLLPGERVRLHAAYATEIAARGDHRSAELARHARASHDLPTALRASIAAGNEALSLAAPREALQHYETALDLLPQVLDSAVDEAELVAAAVDAADAAGQTQRGVRLAERALADLPACAPNRARATLLYATVKAAYAGEIDAGVLARMAEAIHLTEGDPPSAFRARLLAMHSRVAMTMGREVEAVRAAREALEVGEAVEAVDAVTSARTSLAVIERRIGDPDAAVAQLESVVGDAIAAGDAASELRSRYSLAMLWQEQAEPERARDAFAATYERARALGQGWQVFGLHSRAMWATASYLLGDWEDALRITDVRGEQPPPMARAVLVSTGLQARAGRGDALVLKDSAELRKYWLWEGRIPLYVGFAALELHEHRGDVDAALALVDEIVATIQSLWLDPWFLARIQFNAMTLGAVGTAAASAPAARRAELAALGVRLAGEGRMSAAKGLPTGREMGREGLAWLARLEADALRVRWLTGVDAPDAGELVAGWEAAIEAFRYGNVVQVMHCRVRLAAALRATGRPAAADEQAQLAREVAQRLGAAPVLAELATLGGRDVGSERGLAALTQRERDVLAQLVDGRTNRQIAAALFMSEKTASVHVSNIMGKLGVRSRAEAAALARR